jgi:predicted protein tyrosine phosphatase
MLRTLLNPRQTASLEPGKARRLLFVCGHNLNRSLTAEKIYRGFDGYEAKSAGLRPEARVKISGELIEWADLIFVMELEQAQMLRRAFKQSLAGKRLVCLGIPDTYGYMNLELVKVLRTRLKDYIAVPN